VKAKTILAGLAFGALVVAAALLGPSIQRFLAIDSCLDRGGSWDHEARMCRGAR